MNVIVDGNNIFSIDMYGSKECVGVTTEAYLSMKNDAELATSKAEEFFDLKEKYLDKLVEAGLESRPKTQEEINSDLQKELFEQKELNRKILLMMESLSKKLDQGETKNEPKPNPRNRKQVGSEPIES
ncbi:MAG: hypothetical protein R3Y09_06605 [Clostridia bacterium]